MSADIVSACPQTFQVCLEAISAHVSTHLCYGFLPDSAIYGTINLTIHHYGFHNSGAGTEAFAARPTAKASAPLL